MHVSIAAALLVWELVSRTGVISEQDLPSMTTTFRELWSMMQTSDSGPRSPRPCAAGRSAWA